MRVVRSFTQFMLKNTEKKGLLKVQTLAEMRQAIRPPNGIDVCGWFRHHRPSRFASATSTRTRVRWSSYDLGAER